MPGDVDRTAERRAEVLTRVRTLGAEHCRRAIDTARRRARSRRTYSPLSPGSPARGRRVRGIPARRHRDRRRHPRAPPAPSRPPAPAKPPRPPGPPGTAAATKAANATLELREVDAELLCKLGERRWNLSAREGVPSIAEQALIDARVFPGDRDRVRRRFVTEAWRQEQRRVRGGDVRNTGIDRLCAGRVGVDFELLKSRAASASSRGARLARATTCRASRDRARCRRRRPRPQCQRDVDGLLAWCSRTA